MYNDVQVLIPTAEWRVCTVPLFFPDRGVQLAKVQILRLRS